MPPSMQDGFLSMPAKVKTEKNMPSTRMAGRWHFPGLGRLLCWSFILVAFMVLIFHITSPRLHLTSDSKVTTNMDWSSSKVIMHRTPGWEREVIQSSQKARENNLVVLVTGAAGFIGTHVSIALKKRGDGVVGIDNFNDYYDPSLKRSRQGLLLKNNIYVVEGDITEIGLLKRLFDLVTFTHVMHLAAQAGVRYALQNPSSYIHSNIAGLVTLFEACKVANPQPAVVWASSSSVYGLNTKVPFSEADRTDKPASLYAATKKAGEEIAHVYNHIYGLSMTGLRFFTVYGPWGRPDMAYFFFTKDILKGRAIDIYQGPNQVDLARDFTYIDDIVSGCLRSIDTATKSTGSGGKKKGPAQLRVFNLGNTHPVPVPTLVDILEKHLKVKAIRNVIKMPRNGDVPYTHANISLAHAELGYSPVTNLQTGLKKFVKWYLSYYETPGTEV